MTNKLLREKSHCVVCWFFIKIFKTKNKLFNEIINVMYKNKMKIYCAKCRKDTKNIDQKQNKK